MKKSAIAVLVRAASLSSADGQDTDTSVFSVISYDLATVESLSIVGSGASFPLRTES